MSTKKKNLKISDRPTEARFASGVNQLGVWGKGLSDILTALSNSGASHEVTYRYVKVISCNFSLKLFLYFNTKLD